uniref:Putative secreted protein n=1 Tax=Panstrongylus lignarius TaxID=156445 RepID=A0A224XDX4_9HEMI
MSAVFIVLWICQLILAHHRRAVAGYTFDTRTAQSDIDPLIEELWKSKKFTVKNLTENKSNLITTEERNKLTKQNKFQDPLNVTDNGISDLGWIKERISNMEENLVDLRQLYCEEGQAIRQVFKKFDARLGNLSKALRVMTDRRTRQFISLHSAILNKTETQKQQTDQLLTLINDLVNNFKLHVILQPQITDFQKAMVAKNIKRAADRFNKIMDQNESINLIQNSFEVVNNFDCFMELAELLDYDHKLQIYSDLQDLLLHKIGSYADICHFGILLLKMKDLTYGNDEHVPTEELDYSDSTDDSNLIPQDDLYSKWMKEPILANITINIINRLIPLLLKNQHTFASLMVIDKPYFVEQRLIYILPDSSVRQAVYCDSNQIRLEEDNYVAPLDSC